MKKKNILLMFIIVFISCYIAPKSFSMDNLQFVRLDGIRLKLQGCKLFRTENSKDELLYDFKTKSNCSFSLEQDKKNYRKFMTYSGRVIPIEVTDIFNGKCCTKLFAIVKKGDDLYISKKFYRRWRCSGYFWHEKLFHILAFHSMRLPTDKKIVEEAF